LTSMRISLLKYGRPVQSGDPTIKTTAMIFIVKIMNS
jgi:hypothetical protein